MAYEKELQKLKSELQSKEEQILVSRNSNTSVSNRFKENFLSPSFKTKSSHRTNSLCDNSLSSPERAFANPSSEKEQNCKLMILKQRDIMVALSSRLNERDQLISDMKEEMRAYDQYTLNLERKLEKAQSTFDPNESDSINQMADNLLKKLQSSSTHEIQEGKGQLRRLIVNLNKLL